MRQEGEHVGVGQILAVSTPNDGALQTVSQIETLQLQLQQLQFALTSYLDPDAALKLDTSITGDILTLRQSLTGGDYTAAESDIAQLKAAVLKRDHPYTSQEEIQTEIKSVEGQIQSLENSLSGAATVTAKSSGTYSAVCDGYETVLTTEFLEDVTPAKLAKLQPSGEDSNIGKLIYGDTWYYVVTLAEEQANVIRGRSSVTLRFAKGFDQNLQMRVVSVSAAENGQAAVTLSCPEVSGPDHAAAPSGGGHHPADLHGAAGAVQRAAGQQRRRHRRILRGRRHCGVPAGDGAVSGAGLCAGAARRRRGRYPDAAGGGRGHCHRR